MKQPRIKQSTANVKGPTKKPTPALGKAKPAKPQQPPVTGPNSSFRRDAAGSY